jgi:hypothetical protein
MKAKEHEHDLLVGNDLHEIWQIWSQKSYSNKLPSPRSEKKENKKIIPKELLLQFSVIYYKGLEKRFELSDREVCWRNFTLLYLQGEKYGGI